MPAQHHIEHRENSHNQTFQDDAAVMDAAEKETGVEQESTTDESAQVESQAPNSSDDIPMAGNSAVDPVDASADRAVPMHGNGSSESTGGAQPENSDQENQEEQVAEEEVIEKPVAAAGDTESPGDESDHVGSAGSSSRGASGSASKGAAGTDVSSNETESSGAQSTPVESSGMPSASSGDFDAPSGGKSAAEKAGPGPERREITDSYPQSPEEDDSFIITTQEVETTATEQKATNPVTDEVKAAQKAAPLAANEQMGKAQKGQVEAMQKKEPGAFDAAAFKKKLMKKIENMQLPKNLEQANDFENHNNIATISRSASGEAMSEGAKAAGPIEQAVKEQPDPTSVAERSVADLPDAQPGPPPESIAAGEGMPKPRPDSHINYPLEDDMAELQHQHHANDIDDHQLKIANEPAFTAALNAKGKVQENVASAPDKFREQESARQGESDALAEKMSMQQLNAIHQVRTKELVAVTGKQEKAASKDSAARKKVAEDIDGIFKATKKNVNSILTKLNTEVKKKFDTAATSARAQFESFVTTKVSAYKRKRYSGASGKFKWAGDKLLGVPTTITIYFVLGRKLYTDAMDVALTDIANFVATQLTAAKQAIADGKKDVDTYVKKLPANLEQVGQDASRDIQNQFDALTTSVDNCEEDLVDSLAQQYTEHLKQVDARIEQMQEENKGLVTKAGEALDQVVSTIDEIKSTLTKLLAAAISAISVIVKDPIGFLNKLISGIKMGFDNFKTNIVDNIMSGLIQWLTGSMGSVGIQVPKDVLSPSGIFDLSMQVLGLTKDYFRDKAVKLVGKPLVEGMESSIEVFKIVKSDGITGLWKHVKDQFTDIKQVVMDAIRDMIIKKVIEAGIKWIIGLMSPAGAFIKAAMMIVDIVRFFVERGAQIIELVKAFIDGIKAIASGNVKAVAKAVENALIRSIPVLIGFLAALASVSGLTDRVKKIVERLRARVDRVIESVVLKAKKAFKKLVKSGKAKVKGGIEYVRKKLKPWRTKPEKFKSKDKEDHEIFFRDSGEKKVLYVASKNASPVEKFLIDKLGDEKEKDKEAPIREALKYYRDQVKTALDKAIEARKAYKDHKKIKGDKDSERKDSNLKKSADTSRLKVDKALQPFAKKLAKMEFNQESDLAVATHVKFKKKGERAGKVRAMPLTYLPGNTTGARPAGTTPPGYNAVNTAQKNKWERGHLLSDHMHGPAETWNLVPVTRSVNGQMREVENKVKPLIAKQGNVLIYSARVYYNDSFTNELKNVPTKIVLSYGKMKRDPGIPPSDLRFIPDGNAISKTIEQNLDNIDLTGTANQGELMKKDLIAEIPGFIAERKSAGQPYSWRAFSRKKNAIKYWKKNKILTQAQFDAIKKEYAKHV